MTRLSIETRQRVVTFRDAGYTYKEILQRYQTRTRETTSPSSRADKHALARPPALPREQTNTHSRDHQPFLASRQTRTHETTSPSSRADKHALARPPALPREQTNTFSRDHQAFLARTRTRTRETTSPSSRADQHVLARPPGLPRAHTNTYSRESCESLARLSHERVKLLVSGTVDYNNRKLLDLERRGPWSCSAPSEARTLLKGPRLSKSSSLLLL